VPAVYVIRNNGYAISTPESVQTAAATLAGRAEGYGVRGFRVDGNDFLAVVNAVGEAVERARAGEGPTLIEALTYRVGAHSTADDPSAYRSEEEASRWRQLDPLVRVGRHARWRGIFDDEREREAFSRHEQQIAAIVAECEAAPPPPLESLFADVTATITPQLAGQRDAHLRFLADREGSFEDVP
jgi:TPP-dependent pyruvate/acetoin dehydrogenase alpha subunit